MKIIAGLLLALVPFVCSAGKPEDFKLRGIGLGMSKAEALAVLPDLKPSKPITSYPGVEVLALNDAGKPPAMTIQLLDGHVFRVEGVYGMTLALDLGGRQGILDRLRKAVGPDMIPFTETNRDGSLSTIMADSSRVFELISGDVADEYTVRLTFYLREKQSAILEQAKTVQSAVDAGF